MPIPASEPKVLILALIKDNWIAANIAGTLTPAFHTGWWNPKSIGPQVTFTGGDEAYQGDSGYGAIGAAGPVQIVNGQISANCWASRSEGVAGSQNPKLITYDMANEIRRIVLANAVLVTDLEYVSIITVNEIPPETDVSPLTFRKNVTVGYNWRTT